MGQRWLCSHENVCSFCTESQLPLFNAHPSPPLPFLPSLPSLPLPPCACSKGKPKSTWIEAPGESDAGTTYLPSSHYPTVRSRDSRIMLEVRRTAYTGARVCGCQCGWVGGWRWVGGGGKWWVHVCCVGVGVQETLLTICSLALLCVCLSVCLCRVPPMTTILLRPPTCLTPPSARWSTSECTTWSRVMPLHRLL